MTIVTVVVSLGVFLGTENSVKTYYTREAKTYSVANNTDVKQDIERIKKCRS